MRLNKQFLANALRPFFDVFYEGKRPLFYALFIRENTLLCRYNSGGKSSTSSTSNVDDSVRDYKATASDNSTAVGGGSTVTINNVSADVVNAASKQMANVAQSATEAATSAMEQMRKTSDSAITSATDVSDQMRKTAQSAMDTATSLGSDAFKQSANMSSQMADLATTVTNKTTALAGSISDASISAVNDSNKRASNSMDAMIAAMQDADTKNNALVRDQNAQMITALKENAGVADSSLFQNVAKYGAIAITAGIAIFAFAKYSNKGSK